MAVSDLAPQLVLILEPGADARERLAAALAAAGPGGIASVVVARGGEAATRALLTDAQRAGAAALVADDADLADKAGADGVHLTWSEDLLDRYRLARTRLGAGRIVGVDAALSRHDAMTLAEAGADYVAFSDARTDGADVRFSATGADFLALPIGTATDAASLVGQIRAALQTDPVDP
jgi:thiamine-phosphate pyrophosphorylase